MVRLRTGENSHISTDFLRLIETLTVTFFFAIHGKLQNPRLNIHTTQIVASCWEEKSKTSCPLYWVCGG